MRGFLLGLSISLAFMVGCVAGSSGLLLPPARAGGVIEQRWAYFCFERSNIDEINDMANGAGARGWELVAASPKNGANGDAIWCFRQPRP
jgi:hypothetical protein